MSEQAELSRTDPEFWERWEAFAGDEVPHEAGQELDGPTRSLAILAALLGVQGKEAFAEFLPRALESGLTPVMVREAVYQAVAYLGFGKVRPFLTALNEELRRQGVPLPLPGQATATPETRLETGAQVQAEIFGEQMREAWKNGPIERWLAANCFGDYYTRGGLSLNQREMLTFCFLMAQGGCESQLAAHVQGNLRVGNDAAFLTRVVSQCLPYIGYPRSLNALRCIREAASL